MQELFSDSSATGCFARDQNTCLNEGNQSDSDDDSRDLIDLNCYAPILDQVDDDSDTLPSPAMHDNAESGSRNRRKKRRRGKKSPNRGTSKAKSCIAQCTDGINAAVKSVKDAFVDSCNSFAAQFHTQMAHTIDPHASLWQRIQSIPLTPDQKVLIGDYLADKDNEGRRAWLSMADDDTLHAWVFKFLCEKEGLNRPMNLM